MFQVKIHMKNQALFSSKDKKLECRLLQFLFGALRVRAVFFNWTGLMPWLISLTYHDVNFAFFFIMLYLQLNT